MSVIKCHIANSAACSRRLNVVGDAEPFDVFSVTVQAILKVIRWKPRKSHFRATGRHPGPPLPNRRPCSNFPSFPFSCFLPLFSLSVLLPSLSLPLPASGLAVWRKGATPKFFGWAQSLPPHHTPSLPFIFFPFPFSPPLSLRLEVDPSNTARGLGERYNLQSKANLVHFSLKIWHLVAPI